MKPAKIRASATSWHRRFSQRTRALRPDPTMQPPDSRWYRSGCGATDLCPGSLSLRSRNRRAPRRLAGSDFPRCRRELLNSVDRLDTELFTPSQIEAELRALASRAMWTHLAADRVAPLGNCTPDDAESAKTLGLLLQAEPLGLRGGNAFAELVTVLARYDLYFGTRRAESLSNTELISQICLTAALVLDDLALAALDANEVRCIVDSLAVSLHSLGVPASASNEQCEQADVPETSGDLTALVLRRWRLGHHLFNILVSCAARELRAAGTSSSGDSVIEHLQRSTRIFRGSTSAMWYAEASPRLLYLKTIRPTMVEVSGKGSGFSGTDNLEYRWFRREAEALLQRLTDNFGAPKEWPSNLWKEAWIFLETRLLDLEHHTLIAEKVVGLQPSIKQEQLMRAEGDGAAADDMPAVEALRGLASRASALRDGLY